MHKVLLSFDIEEFDLPEEYGGALPFDQQIAISRQGTHHVLDILERQGVKATFFSTVAFAEQVPDVIARIRAGGHELASHGMVHSGFATEHLRMSRERLSVLSGMPVAGFRMPRMAATTAEDLVAAGYHYDSSLNPTFLPGRYNHLDAPRICFKQGQLWQLPASVTPMLRWPLFWLSCHHLPYWLYRMLCRRTLQHDGYLNLYFHPWEFMSLQADWGIPWLVRRNTGNEMLFRLESLIEDAKSWGGSHITISDFLDSYQVR